MKKNKRSAAQLTVLGVGEAFDTGLGNNSCLLSGRRTPTVLLDCGYQIPERLWCHPGLSSSLELICLSHFHADHAFGVVPVLMRFWEEKRKRPLWIAGPRGIEKQIQRVFELGYPNIYPKLEFDLHFHEGRPGQEWEWNGLKLRFASTRHSVDNLSVRIDGAFGSLGFSGDGALTPSGRKLFRDVDFLVQEVFSVKPTAPVHFDLQGLQSYLEESEIGHVGITHCSRHFRREIARRVEALRRKDSRWLLLEPGMEVHLSV